MVYDPSIDDSAHGGIELKKSKSSGFIGVDEENIPKDAFVPSPSFRSDIGKGKRFQALWSWNGTPSVENY